MPNEEEEFDEIVWEMALAVKECTLSNPEARNIWLMNGSQWKNMNNATTC
jgi:hypothetical protein